MASMRSALKRKRCGPLTNASEDARLQQMEKDLHLKVKELTVQEQIWVVSECIRRGVLLKTSAKVISEQGKEIDQLKGNYSKYNPRTRRWEDQYGEGKKENDQNSDQGDGGKDNPFHSEKG